MFHPLVSIIIPVYNGANYMREAIDSALAQTYNNTEVIVVNDGSNDEGATDRIARSYGDRVRYFTKENGGVSSALNLGIRMMKGDYLSWLSHDDMYAPTKIEKQVALIAEQARDNTIAMCARQQINSESVKIGSSARSNLPLCQVLNWKQALMYVINHSCNGCALLIPKALLSKCEEFDENLRYSQDFLMWARLFMSGASLIYHDDVEVFSRVHSQQVTVAKKDLFLHDSTVIAELLSPDLAGLSDENNAFLYAFAKTNAIHLNPIAVECCIEFGRRSGTITAVQSFKLKLLCVYGAIRPCLRKVYYCVVKRTKI